LPHKNSTKDFSKESKIGKAEREIKVNSEIDDLEIQ